MILTFSIQLDVENEPTQEEVTAAEERLRTYANGVVLGWFETAGRDNPKSTRVAGHMHGDNHSSYNACKFCMAAANYGQWENEVDSDRYGSISSTL